MSSGGGGVVVTSSSLARALSNRGWTTFTHKASLAPFQIGASTLRNSFKVYNLSPTKYFDST